MRIRMTKDFAGGIKCEVTVLVTAEMIALTYYELIFERESESSSFL